MIKYVIVCDKCGKEQPSSKECIERDGYQIEGRLCRFCNDHLYQYLGLVEKNNRIIRDWLSNKG